MVEVGESVLLEALRRHLQEELGLHRQMLSLAEDKRSQIVAGDIKAFSSILEEEQRLLAAGAELRRRRDELLRRIALGRRIPAEQLRLKQLLERTPEPLRGQLSGLQSDLVGLLSRLREVNERNMLLIRQSLSFVHDLMNIVLGGRTDEDYDRQGRQGPMKGRGGLADFQA
jgi:flagellar biosynthesis/type III secretory pathway chaperone